MRKLVLSLAAVAAVGAVLPATSAAKTVTLVAKMKGSAEVPGPGDSDGKGKATLRLNAARGKVCYTLKVKKIGAASAAHIHTGASGVAGNVLVALLASTTPEKTIEGCVRNVDSRAIRDIVKHPGGFYVNVHNADFPNGAIRGQLRAKN